MKPFLRIAFAVLVITGWFVFALWIVLSVVQIGMMPTGCSLTSPAEVRCVPHAAALLLLPRGFGNRGRDAHGNVHALTDHRGLPVLRNPGRYRGRHRV